MLQGPKHLWNLYDSIFIIFFITQVENELQNVCFSDKWTLRTFVNTLTANDKHSLCNRDNLRQPIQTKLSKKEKAPSEFWAAFLKSSSHFKDFENKMNFIAYKFWKLQTARDVVRQTVQQSTC